VKFVIDASVAARWFLSNESDQRSDAVLERVLKDPDLFAVPELFFFEVLSVLGRTHPRPLKTYREAFLPVVEAGIFRHPMTATLAGHCERFMARGLTGYDACYAGLAAEISGTWITFDRDAHERIADARVSADLGQGLPANW